MPHEGVFTKTSMVPEPRVMETSLASAPISTARLAEQPVPRPRVPAKLQRELRRLLGQQFWLFGWDIRRAEGNLLSALGFEKARQPISLNRPPTRYERHAREDVTITLWGFGLMWRDAERGAVFLSRHAFAPRYCRTPESLAEVWTPDAIPGLERPSGIDDRGCCQQLVLDALAWIAGYERFVHGQCGAAYRTEAISGCRCPVGTGEDLIVRWDDAGAALAQVYGMPPGSRSRHFDPVL